MYELEKNAKQYWDFILDLRNDSRVKAGFIQQHHIKEKEHYKYMKSFGENFYICLDKGAPVGYIGIISDDIRVTTHPDHRGKGVAKFMVNEMTALHPAAVAKVKIENEASLKLFKSCGFVKKYYILEKE